MTINRNDVLDRLAPLFESPDASFETFLRRRDRRVRRERIVAGVVAVLVFAAAIWLIAGGPAHRTHVPADGGSGNTDIGPTVPPGTTVGIVGLAPEGMTPSDPVTGDLVLGFFFGHTGGDMGRFELSVYDDGRVIWQKLGDRAMGLVSTGLVEQRLTLEGVELVRAEALASGVFRGTVHYVARYGLFFGSAQLRDGDTLVGVSWGDIDWGPDGETVPTPDQVTALTNLDARLEDLTSWLPAAAWQDINVRPVVPSKYSLCFNARTPLAITFDVVLGSLPPEAADAVRALDATFEEESSVGLAAVPWHSWCAQMTTRQAHALAAVFEGAGLHGRSDEFGVEYVANPRGNPAEVTFGFSPVRP
jgi:hypothetical protein